MNDREALAAIIEANCSVTRMMSDGYLSVMQKTADEIADAILAAGWVSPEGVRAAQAEALREAAQCTWGIMARSLNARADALAPTAEPAPTEPCGFQSASSDDGYCRCILPKHDGRHKCIHGWLS